MGSVRLNSGKSWYRIKSENDNSNRGTSESPQSSITHNEIRFALT